MKGVNGPTIGLRLLTSFISCTSLKSVTSYFVSPLSTLNC